MIPDTYAVPRRSERKSVKRAVVLMVESADSEILHEGTTIDMSDYGAKVEAEADLTPGQTITLIQPDDPARSYRCMVVWAGDVGSDGHEHVGLEFLSPLSVGPEN